MAETAVGLARSAVGSVLSKAASAAAEEMSLLLGVQQEIWFIKDELHMIQAFLCAVEGARENNNQVVKAWVKQVRDLAYDIQDCLDEFAAHVGRKSLSRQLMKLGARHRIAVQIRNLKARVEEVSKRNLRYNLITAASSSSFEDIESNVELTRHLSPLYIEESQLIGMERPKAEVVEWIKDPDEALRVISVVGTGGLGKTTLVKKVYDSMDISGLFKCRAWVTVSQSFDNKDLFKRMLQQLVGDERYKKLEKQRSLSGVEQVTHHITNELKENRYLLVLDDLWTISAWDYIKVVLSDSNKKGSRVVVTTRDAKVANHCTSSHSLIHNLRPLPDGDSLELLLRKISKNREDLKLEKLDNLINDIVKKCGGLPLAIISVGGLLRNKPTKEWQNLYDRIPSELETNPSLEAMRRVVTLSYNYLPDHLKPCFLYLSIFPEDFEIERTCLVNRWIAEGFVREKAGATIEEVAEDYLYELINRSMIQPLRTNIRGKVKSIRVHDIFRDVIIATSREENLVFLIEEHNTIGPAGNIRHLAFHAGEDLLCTFGVDLCRVRSLTVFDKPMESLSSLCSLQLRMLRVVALENARFVITQQDMRNIGSLCHLRYLSVYDSYVYALPRSIENLQDLQTLDIRKTYITRLPTEISRLQRLRNLRWSKRYLGYYDPSHPIGCLKNMIRLPINLAMRRLDHRDRARAKAAIHAALSGPFISEGVKVPRDIGSLKYLQRLEFVDIKQSGSTVIKELGKLSQLRKLRVGGLTGQNWMEFCGVLHKLSSLRSLHIEKQGANEPPSQLDSYISPPPLLESLAFWGHLGKLPAWVTHLDKLSKIKLWLAELMEGDVIKILKGSPNLVSLHLLFKSYVGRGLVFCGETFAKLRMLQLYDLGELVGITFGEDVLPQLETISIRGCRLESGISGIKHLPKLKEISLGDYGRVRELDMLHKEVAEHPNDPRPVLQMKMDRSHHDLGPKADAAREQSAAASVGQPAEGSQSQSDIDTPRVREEVGP